MSILISSIFMLGLMTGPSSAQWVQRIMSSSQAMDVTCLVTIGTNLFAGTDGGGVSLSTDNGSTWTAVNAGLANTDVMSLAVLGTDLFAATYGGGVFLSTNNGVSWEAVNNGLTANNDIVALVVSGTNIFAAAWNHGVFLSTNMGSSWTAIDSNLTNLDVESLGVGHANVFAGTSWGTFLTDNDGRSWIDVDSSATALAFAVSGTNLFAATYNGVSISTDDGTKWTAVDSGLTTTVFFSIAVSGTNVFAATQSGGVFLSTNDGTNWTAVDSGLTTSSDVKSLIVSGSNLYAGTFGSGVWVRPLSEMVPGGASWTQVNTGLTNENVVSLAASDTAVLAGTQDGVFLSTDQGETWSAAFNDVTGFSYRWINAIGISGPNWLAGSDNVFLSGNSGTSWNNITLNGSGTTVTCFAMAGRKVYAGTETGVYLSNDNGQTWSQIGLASTFLDAIAVSDGSIFAGTLQSGGVYRSTDGGKSWRLVGCANSSVISLIAFNGDVFAGTNYGVFRSTDNGESWQQLGPSDSYYSFASHGNDLFAAGLNGSVQMTTDYGLTWTRLDSGLASGQYIDAIAVSNDYLYVGTQSTNVAPGTGLWRRSLPQSIGVPMTAPVLVIPANGSTTRADSTVVSWNAISNGSSYEIEVGVDSNFVNIVKDTLCTVPDTSLLMTGLLGETTYFWRVRALAASDTGGWSGYWRFATSTATGIDGISGVPNAFALFQNYPNPFNPSTVITYDIAKRSHVMLTVYDILGRQVATLVNAEKSPGQYQATFDGADLPSGVYLYRIHAGNYTATKKLVLVK